MRWVDSAGAVAMTAAGPASFDEFALPIGTVTFLLTDIEGSTKAWSSAPDAMGPAVARHYEILDAAVAAHGGVRPQEQGEGDSIVAAFARSSDAVRAAVDAQARLASEPWPPGVPKIAVRMAVHTGEAQLRNEANYVGQAIIRTARLRAIAHGGQVIVSQAARDLAIDQLGTEIELVDLGIHRLKDLARPEHVWQVTVPGTAERFPPLNSLDSTPNNLPSALSTFVGRHLEVEAVVRLVRGNRLVTVMGTGGAGKTRLAQQAAAQAADQFPDGAWWVELAPLAPDDVLREAAQILSLKDPASLVQKLRTQRMLLVFDNCEHVLEAVAPLIGHIVQSCPGVHILTTSRGSIDVPGEVTWKVPPLGLPVADRPISVERLAQFDAVRLFIDRAQRARPNFALNDSNGPAVAEICSRLDGLPLSIELAAARAKSLTPQQILAGLEHSLQLLTGGSRLVLPRQQTLEASIAWSHALLGPVEQVLLRRVSVFCDGWNLEAAESVCSDATLSDMAILDALERLIDQSLIAVSDDVESVRYRALETVRQYGITQLANAGEEAAILQRHAEHFVELARNWAPRCETSDEPIALSYLVPENANFAATLRWVRENRSAEEYSDLVSTLTPYWTNSSGSEVAGIAACTVALELLGENSVDHRIRMLRDRSECRSRLGLMILSFFDASACVELANASESPVPVGRARSSVAMLSFNQASGRELMAQAEDEMLAVGDQFGWVLAQNRKGSSAVFTGDAASLRRVLDDTRSAVTELGNPSLMFGWAVSEVMAAVATSNLVAAWAAIATVRRLKPTSIEAEAWEVMATAHFAEDDGRPATPIADLEALVARLTRLELLFIAAVAETWIAMSLIGEGEFDRARAFALERVSTPMPGFRRIDMLLFAVQCSLALGETALAEEQFSDATTGMGAEFAQADTIRWRTAALQLQSVFSLGRGELIEAEGSARRCLEVAVEHGYRREVIAAAELLVAVAAARGSWIDAARLAGFVSGRRDDWSLRMRLEPVATVFDGALESTRDALGGGSPSFDETSLAGYELSVDAFVEYVSRTHHDRGRATIGWASLTPTERRVADLVRAGKTNAEVARELLMGTETVKTHVSRVYGKLAVANRTQLAALPSES